MPADSTGRPAIEPDFTTRALARLRGEVPAAELEAYRRAGGVAYEELERAEALRSRLAAQGVRPRDARPAEAGQLLSAWNAFVLQTLGERMLEADYAADPRTVGYLPPVTARQVRAFFDQVEGWVARARQAALNPDFRVERSTYLPAELPRWEEVRPCPPAHLWAMLAASRTIRAHAEAAIADFERARPADDEDADVPRLRQLFALGATAADYADGLLTADPTPALHEAIERRLQHALQTYYLVGQMAAMPGLFDIRTSGGRDHPVSVPDPGPIALDRIDKWCLTDPNRRNAWRRDPHAQRAIEELWRNDPMPALTLRIQAEIDFALEKRVIDFARDRAARPLPSFHRCPFPAIYLANRPVWIDRRRIRPMEQFTYLIEHGAGMPFQRAILVGTFGPVGAIEYRPSTQHLWPYGNEHRF